jgi:hypothetical protein
MKTETKQQTSQTLPPRDLTRVPFAPGYVALILCEPGDLPVGIAAWAVRLTYAADKPPVVGYLVPGKPPERTAVLCDALTAKILGTGADALKAGEIPPPLRLMVSEIPGGEERTATRFRIPDAPGVYEFLAAVYEKDEREAL